MRRRYLALAVDAPVGFSSKEFMDAVWEGITKLYGEYGASRTGLSLISYDLETKFAVIRVWHNALEIVRTSLASIIKIENKPVVVQVLAVSGTIKALDKKTRTLDTRAYQP